MADLFKEGDRVLCVRSGKQFAGTIDGDGDVFSDLDGSYWAEDQLDSITKLEGIYAAKVGDVIVNEDGEEAKILEIGASHTAFLKSNWSDFDDAAASWDTFKEAERFGWKLKDQPESEDKTEEAMALLKSKGYKITKK